MKSINEKKIQMSSLPKNKLRLERFKIPHLCTVEEYKIKVLFSLSSFGSKFSVAPYSGFKDVSDIPFQLLSNFLLEINELK